MPYADQPTIVLGADGFIGRNLLAYWRDRNWPVHPLGRAAGDFTDAAVVDGAFRAAPRAGRILHAITKQRTGAVQYEIQGELLRDNARIHLNVLEAWRRYQPQAKLISLGSSCTYPESSQPLGEGSFGIGTPHPSVRGYALAKQVLAMGCDTYGGQYGLNWLHCVLATVYGPGGHTEVERSHFMQALIARAAGLRRSGAAELEVWGDLNTVRDVLYVSDQIEALIEADGHFDNAILNVTANRPVTVGECAEAILAALAWPARIVKPSGSFQGAHYKSLDSSRFLTATSWSPKVGLEEGVRRTLAAGPGDRWS